MKVLGPLGLGPGPGQGWSRLQLACIGALVLSPGLPVHSGHTQMSQRDQLPTERSVTPRCDSGLAARPLPEPLPGMRRGMASAFHFPYPHWPLAAFILQALDEHPLCAELCPGYRSRKDGLSRSRWTALISGTSVTPSGPGVHTLQGLSLLSLVPHMEHELRSLQHLVSLLATWSSLLMHLSGTSCEIIILEPVTQEPSPAPLCPGAPSEHPPPHIPGMRFGSRIF